MSNKPTQVDSIESTNISESTHDEEKRKFLLTDENFHKLRNLQQQIYEATDLSPSMRKLINALITDEQIDQLATQLKQHLTLAC